MTSLRASILPVTPFQQNCTFLFDDETKSGVVIDPGGEVDRIRAAIDEIGMTVERIVLTHGHIDHAGGAAELKEALGVEIVGPHLEDAPMMMRLEDQAKMFGLPVGSVRNVKADRWLEEGETLTMAGVDFDVYHCPGHSPGSVAFVNQAMNFAIVGDVLFRGSVGRTDLPGGDHDTLMASIKDKLLPLGDDIAFLCGHGPGSTFGTERRSNPFLV
ncbi:MAG: MBL fold metallo-hydrolase [Rhodobiaceae bacterium]|nr:MBL fold metallo-hydrolase [Rhodobiaceae bacterium]